MKMALDAAVPQIGLWRATSAAYKTDDDSASSCSAASHGSQFSYSSFAELKSQWEERSACSSKAQSRKKGGADGRNGAAASGGKEGHVRKRRHKPHPSNLHASLTGGGAASAAGSSIYQTLYGKRGGESTGGSTRSGGAAGKENGGRSRNGARWCEKKRGFEASTPIPTTTADPRPIPHQSPQKVTTATDANKESKEGAQPKSPSQSPAKTDPPKEPPKDEGKTNRMPELASFLNSPTGLNWEDLVRSMKKQRAEPLLNKTIEVADDDDVSELGSREGNRCLRDYEVDWIHDAKHNRKKRDTGKEDSGNEDDLSVGSSISSKSQCPARREGPASQKGGVGCKAREGKRDEMVGKVIGESPPQARTQTDSPKEPASTGQLSPIINSPPRSKPVTKDSLERRIERVVTGQMAETEEAVAAPPKTEPPEPANEEPPPVEQQRPQKSSRKHKPTKRKKKMPTITPPRRDRRRESSHRAGGKNSLGSVGFVTPSPGSPTKPLLGRAGSAFSPVQSSTPSTAVETLEASPRSAFSKASLDDPGRAAGAAGDEAAGPERGRTFSPIEPQEASPQHRQQGQSPVPSPRLVSPRVQRAVALREDERGAGAAVSAATRRREARWRRYGSPSDPPLLSISYSDEADEEAEAGRERTDVENADTGECEAIEFDAAFPADPLEEIAQKWNVEGELTEQMPQPENSTAQGSSAAKLNDSGAIRDDEEEVATTATAAGEGLPTLTVLPRSLSVNRKAPTCWQVARHRMLPTRGEF